MTGGLPPAPRWAWIVMGLGVVAIAVLSYLIQNRPPPPSFTAPAAADKETAAPSSAAATEQLEREAVRILVVGDGFTTASPEGTVWPDLVRADLEAAGRPVDDVTVTAALGSGYAQPDPNGVTFPVLAEQAGGNFDVVVFFGSRHDIAAAVDVAAAADAAFAAVRASSPDAGLVVIGPAWATPDAPGYIETNRDALATAVAPSDASFVDPLTEGWFAGTAAELVAPDGQRPTAEGHRYLADLIRPLIEAALPAPS